MKQPTSDRRMPFHNISLWFSALLRWSGLQRLVAYLGRRRVTVILQERVTECGAACLAMILNYYGRHTSIDECREALGIGRDGVTIRTIAKSARDYGLRVKAFSVDLDQFMYVPLPAIAHWNFDHFVVVERWTPS